MTAETMIVQIERARAQARDMDAPADVRDRWYQSELQCIEKQAEHDRQAVVKAENHALMDEGRLTVRALLHPDEAAMRS